MQMTFTITGGVNVEITVTEQDNGSLRFDLQVLDDTGMIGDLNAVFFDMALNVGGAGLAISGTDVTGTAVKEAGVTKVASYTTMTGEVLNQYGKFDVGVQFGTSGIGKDDIRSTSFVLSSTNGTSLSLEDIAVQDFGVRLTSVGVEGGSRDGSLKLGGESGEVPVDPPPSHLANDDHMFVILGDIDEFDFLDEGVESVLANDTTDAGAYLGSVFDGNGAALAPDAFITLTGSNGGTLDLYGDGRIDFHSGDIVLGTGEVATTEFVYAIEGGDTATIVVDMGGFGGGPD